MLIRPVAVNPSPTIVVLIFGGLVGSVVALGVLYGAAVAGAPRLDVLTAIGSIFTETPGVALGVGAVLLLGATVTFLPLMPLALSTVLPSPHDTLRGALVNGAAVGGSFWIAVGLVLGVAALISDAPLAAATPGVMGLSQGIAGGVLFVLASLLYGVSVTLIAFMEQGLSPFDAIGWSGFTHAAAGPLELGAHRSGEPPAPGRGERPWRDR